MLLLSLNSAKDGRCKEAGGRFWAEAHIFSGAINPLAEAGGK